jgi:hypothetical protein
MLPATWRGTSAQRRALRSAGFNFRHCETFFCQVMEAIYTNESAGKTADLTQSRQGAKPQRRMPKGLRRSTQLARRRRGSLGGESRIEINPEGT